MSVLLFLFAVASLRLPSAETFQPRDWQPTFSEPKDVLITQPTLAILTHCSRHFDPLELTKPAVSRVLSTMKSEGLPVVYLHDRYNDRNPAWMYLYSDWRPTAYVASDVGHVDINLTCVRHLISLGGYFGQCQQTTLGDAIRCWQRDAPADDFRITQVVDGIFCVTEHVRLEDEYSTRVRAFLSENLRRKNPNASIMVAQILSHIVTRSEALEYLCRQIPAVPDNVNVVIDYFGFPETLRVVEGDAPTLTIAYRRANDFLQYRPVTPDPDNLSTLTLQRVFRAPRVAKVPVPDVIGTTGQAAAGRGKILPASSIRGVNGVSGR